MKRILLVAGDPSGDFIASQLVATLKKLQPSLEIVGLGGKHLQSVADRFLGNIVNRHALGFAISPKVILYFRHVLNDIIEPELEKNPPDAVIPVDFYGFNSRVAALAKKKGCQVFYYASPQFWASRPGRADKLRNIVDLFLCLFPFEVEFYKRRGLPAKFVSHPLLDVLPDAPASRPPRVESLVGLLPGSRPEEIRRHLPVMVEACDIIFKSNAGVRFLLFTVPHVPRDFYHDLISTSKQSRCLIELVQDENFQWRSQLDLAITASGMETLENALFGIPMVVMYKTDWFTYLVARAIIRIPFVGMPNLLSGQQVVPEFVQWEVTAGKIAEPILYWLKNPSEKEKLRQTLLNLRGKFGREGACDRAARAILEKVA